MKKLLLIVSVMFFGLSLSAQDVAFTKKNFPTQKKALKQAVKAIKTADKEFNQFVPAYRIALDSYKEAYKLNPNNSYLNYKIGVCVLNTTQKFDALPYFEKAKQLNKNVSPDIDYYIGRGYHLAEDWDTAIDFYKRYRATLSSKTSAERVKDVEKKISECESGKILVKNPVKVWIDNMGKNVNSAYPDYGMVITADASEIYFTSRRPNTTGGKLSDFDMEYYEDIYMSTADEDGWTSAKNIGSPINTSGHDAAVALSPDGSKMILYIDTRGDGNLYESVKKGGKWSKPRAIKEINTPFHEASAWYSPDGRQLYFTSDRPDNIKGGVPGSRDIFVADWNAAKEKWENIRRLPANVNSEYDEDGVFMHPDGKTLYFSSKGHNSMGGYDVFKTIKQEDGTWSDPENMGYPINTPDDDVFFTLAANGRDAFLTSYRAEGLGDKDLYHITILGNTKPVMTGEEMLLANEGAPIRAGQIEVLTTDSGSKLMILKGVIRDAKTRKPLGADIELTDNNTGAPISNFVSDPETGRYLVILPGGRDYGLAVKSQGYLFHSENFNVKETDGYQEVELDIDLNRLEAGSTIALRNVFFDLDKYSLRDASITELNRVIQIMNDYPKMEIELSGHTDTRGSAAYNKTLSQNRAKAVLEYLVKNGIDRSRLKSVGFGFEKTMISDEEIAKIPSKEGKEEAHQQNRRTELKILKM